MRKRVFNVGDEIKIHSREYGVVGKRAIIKHICKSGTRYPYRVVDDSGESFELCSAEMRKVPVDTNLTKLEDWS